MSSFPLKMQSLHLQKKMLKSTSKQESCMKDSTISKFKWCTTNLCYCTSTFNVQRLIFSNTSSTGIKGSSFNFFAIQPALELFERVQKGLFKELNIKVEKSNGQSRNPEFRDVIKKQPQNQFRNRSDPMHPSNKDRKPCIIKKFVTKKD